MTILSQELPVLNKSNAIVGNLYKFCSGYMILTKIYEASPEEIEEFELYHHTRYEAYSFTGHFIGAGLHD